MSIRALLLSALASLTLAVIPESHRHEASAASAASTTLTLHTHPGIPPGYIYVGCITEGGVVKCVFENPAGNRIIEVCPD